MRDRSGDCKTFSAVFVFGVKLALAVAVGQELVDERLLPALLGAVTH